MNQTLVKFDVDRVPPSTTKFPTIASDIEALRRLSASADTLRKDSNYSGQNKLSAQIADTRRIEAISMVPRPLVEFEYSDENGPHPVIEALNVAYDEHLAIRFSPDMIWLMIAHGVSLHLQQNPGDGPKHLSTSNKQHIEIERNEFVLGSKDNDWAGVVAEFGDKIRELAGADFHDQFSQSFSTTTSIEATAMKVSLMEAGSLYFTYGMTTRCGIPSIELEGTVEDWQKIADLAPLVAQYGMDWWVPFLTNVTNAFLEAAKGNADPYFWQSFFKVNNASGGPFIDGYVVQLFPYLVTSIGVIKNKYIDPVYQGGWGGPTAEDFPGGYSIAPMRWKYYEQRFGIKLIAGFTGCSQDDSLTLRPEIGWVIVEAPSVLSEDASLKENERSGTVATA